MPLYTYSGRLRRVLEQAVLEAHDRHHENVGTEHMMLGLLAESEGGAMNVLAAAGLDRPTVTAQIQSVLKPGSASGPDESPLTHTTRATMALQLALEEAESLRHEQIGTAHLLLGLLRAMGVAGQVLTRAGLTLEAARAATVRSADD